jgi:5-methylthioadenosine/S-adenosylhomocysteine deaminase
VLQHHAVAIRDGLIEQVLPASEALREFPNYENVELPNHVLIPGLVNAHTQAATSLMRGLAPERQAAAEKRVLSAEFVREGTALACADMLLGGITCFSDMYFFPEASLEAALEAGMRVVLGLPVMDQPTPYASDPADYLRKGLALRDRYGDEPLASFSLAPHAPYSVPDAAFRQVATLAAELDLLIHVHVHETRTEVERSVAQHGTRPLERLRKLGLLGPNLIAVHCVHVEDHEIELLARHGCSVVHCPSSNLKLASGFAPVGAMLERGVNLALGTDGPASNNRLDLLGEMRTAALVAKAVAHDARALPAPVALRAATLGGARALGQGAKIGSIEPGKRADLVALAVRGPCYDPISHVVYAAGREDVTHVWVNGELRVRDGALETEVPALHSRWQIWQNALEGPADS